MRRLINFCHILITTHAFSFEFCDPSEYVRPEKPKASQTSYREKYVRSSQPIQKQRATSILDEDNWGNIFEFIEGDDFERLLLVCKTFYDICQNPRFVHHRSVKYFCQISKGQFVELRDIFNESNKKAVCEKLKLITSRLEHSGLPAQPEDASKLIHNWQLYHDLVIMRIQLDDRNAENELLQQLKDKKRTIKIFSSYCKDTKRK